MKKKLFICLLLYKVSFIKSQDKNLINTAVPFLNIPTDARSGAMGDVGVSTSADSYSQNWNPSKYAFIEQNTSIAFSYSPWMNKQMQNSFLADIFFHTKINKSSALALSFKYFSLENIDEIDILNNGFETQNPEFKPRELALDASYSMKLTDNFSMGVALRYINSSIADKTINQNYQNGSSMGVDISAFYQAPVFSSKFFRFGMNISNLGPDISYGKTERYSALPSNLRLGVSNEFSLGRDGMITIIVETNKLLVETPKNDGVITNGSSNGISGVFKSLYEAPGGFSEKIKEFSLQTGLEYNLKNQFFIRTGFIYESPYKGYRRAVNIGLGFVYNYATLDFSYLYSLSKFQTPLDNSLRLSISINIDKFDF